MLIGIEFSSVKRNLTGCALPAENHRSEVATRAISTMNELKSNIPTVDIFEPARWLWKNRRDLLLSSRVKLI